MSIIPVAARIYIMQGSAYRLPAMASYDSRVELSTVGSESPLLKTGKKNALPETVGRPYSVNMPTNRVSLRQPRLP